MSSFRWGMVAYWTPTNSQVTVWELRQLLFSAHCSTVVFLCFASCSCLSPPGWEKVLSLEMMWTWLGALSFDVNGLYESQTTFPFLWGSNLNQNKPVDSFLDSSPIQNQTSLVQFTWLCNILDVWHFKYGAKFSFVFPSLATKDEMSEIVRFLMKLPQLSNYWNPQVNKNNGN